MTVSFISSSPQAAEEQGPLLWIDTERKILARSGSVLHGSLAGALGLFSMVSDAVAGLQVEIDAPFRTLLPCSAAASPAAKGRRGGRTRDAKLFHWSPLDSLHTGFAQAGLNERFRATARHRRRTPDVAGPASTSPHRGETGVHPGTSREPYGLVRRPASEFRPVLRLRGGGIPSERR